MKRAIYSGPLKDPVRSYGDGQSGKCGFIRRCPKCSRFVRADKRIYILGLVGIDYYPTATCRRCGRVEMPFLGFV